MKLQGKIIYVVKAHLFEQVKEEVVQCLTCGISLIRLSDYIELTVDSYNELLERFENVDFILSEGLAHKLGVSPKGVFYPLSEWNNFEQIDGQIAIGKAYSVVDCKNWELKKVNGIDFSIKSAETVTPFNKGLLGTEGLSSLIPKHEEYGWMILSLNTPVFISDIRSFKEIESVCEVATIYGVVIDPSVFLSPLSKDLVIRIQELLD